MKKTTVIFALIAFLTLVYPGSAGCISCHSSDQQIYTEIYPAINTSIFGAHQDINITDGGISDSDCRACHYDTSDMYAKGFTVATYTCEGCHISNTSGIVPADRIVYNHIPNGSTNISLTKASCGDCHNKTANLSRYSANASAAHYGRNASFGLSPGASYCAYCHANSSTVYRDLMQNQNNAMLGN